MKTKYDLGEYVLVPAKVVNITVDVNKGTEYKVDFGGGYINARYPSYKEEALISTDQLLEGIESYLKRK